MYTRAPESSANLTAKTGKAQQAKIMDSRGKREKYIFLLGFPWKLLATVGLTVSKWDLHPALEKTPNENI